MFRQRLAGEFEVGFEYLHGVAGTALFGLEDELDAGGCDCSFDAFGLVADDAVDLVCGDYGLCGCDNVEEKSAATDLVEDFGALTFEPRAFACGHDGDGEFVGDHRSIWSHVRVGSILRVTRDRSWRCEPCLGSRRTCRSSGTEVSVLDGINRTA